MNYCPIGIFDSGYGGLTVFQAITAQMPDYDYIYLGDNGRAPYGNRSFETVHQYTLQSVEWFFKMGCKLVILACNTASAKALRTIQQTDLAHLGTGNRVLGVIRPTAEVIGNCTRTGDIGILGTKGTIQSRSYDMEIAKFFPDVRIFSLACPIWVPLVEYGEYKTIGADYFVKKYLDELFVMHPSIDTLLLACTHYPLLIDKIQKYAPTGTTIVSQGAIVAESLKKYLARHPEMEENMSKNRTIRFFTTDDTADFDRHGGIFYGSKVKSEFAIL